MSLITTPGVYSYPALVCFIGLAILSVVWLVWPYILRWFICSVIDRPKSDGSKRHEEVLNGDGYDQFSGCTRCGKRIHRDTHMYGDGRWRHD